MSFFEPQHLLWGLLAIAIVLAYYLRARRQHCDVSALMLWERAFRRRNKWRKWKRPVSVLILIMILAAIVFAAASPYWTSSLQTARTLIVIVDNSASMNATDVAPTRLAVAHGKLVTLIDGMRRFERMAIVSAGGRIRLHSRVSGDKQALRTAAHRITPMDGPNRLDDALALARRLAAEHANPEIYLLSDGCFDGAAELQRAADVRLVRCAAMGDDQDSRPANVAITQLAARGSVADPGHYEALLEVTNYSAASREVGVKVSLPDGQVWSEGISIGPQESRQRVRKFKADRGGLLSAKLDVEDDLTADNVAWLSIAPHPAISLKLAATAVSADPGSSTHRLLIALKTVPLVRVGRDGGDPLEADSGAITVITGTVPQQLPPGPVLAIAPSGDCELWRDAGSISGTVIVDEDPADHEAMPLRAVLAGVDLENLVVESLMAAEFLVKPAAVVRSAAGDPVLSAWQRPEGRVLLLHLPLDQTDLTLRHAFPILISNAVRWLADRQAPFANCVVAGELLSLPFDPLQETRQLRSPGGRVVTLAVGQTAAGPLDEVGVWTVESVPPSGDVAEATKADGAGGDVNDSVDDSDEANDDETPARGTIVHFAACNLLNPMESDLAANPELAGSKSDTQPAGDVPTPWALLLLVASVLLTADWLLVQRGILI